MDQFPWDALAVGAALTFAAQPIALRLLRARNVLDIPNERSSHSTPTPRGGGWGIVVAATAIYVVGAFGHGHELPFVAAAACLIAAAVGGFDDLHGLSARTRLALQVGIALLVVGGYTDVAPSPWEIAISVLLTGGVVAYVNAFNFMDGINGVSAISGFAAATWLGVLAVVEGQAGLAWLAAGVAGSCVGFLPWNFPRARIFLGDVGSYFLGAALAALAVAIWSAGAPPAFCIAPLGPYLFDTGVTLARRAARRERLMQAHREHMYQLLAARTGHVGATVVVALVTVACVAAAVVAERGDWLLGALSAGGAFAVYWAVSVQRGAVR